MKIGERWVNNQDGTITQVKSFDIEPALKRAEALRHMADATGQGVKGEHRHVGDIPTFMIVEWCKEAGVRYDDLEARREVVKRKILSGEFDKFRVWKGRF